MVNVIVTNKVSDFDKWKAVFDSNRPMRAKFGELSDIVYRGLEDRNLVTIVFEWESIEKAKAFDGSEELRKALKGAGVIEKPDVRIAEKISSQSVAKAA